MVSAAAFSLTCAGLPDSGMAITFPLRMTQPSATAAAEQPCWAPICASVRHPTAMWASSMPPSGDAAITGILCCAHHGRTSRSMERLLRL